jgi:uncharacterized protein (TIGR03083 family)
MLCAVTIADEIARTRRELAGYLSALEEPDWEGPSLCAGWTVRTVVGHLVSPLLLNTAQVFAAYARRGFRFHKLMDSVAREQAERPTAELVRILRDKAEGGFVPPIAGERAILLDVTLHHMDIRWPRRQPPKVDPSVLLTCLNFMVSGNQVLKIANPYRFHGVRLEATDPTWSYGEGPVVRGPADAMLLATFGRAAGLDRLEGDGVAELRRRIA